MHEFQSTQNRRTSGKPLASNLSVIQAHYASIFLAFTIVVAAVFGHLPAHASGPDSFADLAAERLDAVVNIATTQQISSARAVPLPQLPPNSPFREFFDDFFKDVPRNGGRPGKVQSLGSGFIIDPAGYIVTNNHVIEGADKIVVKFHDGTELNAKLVGRDPRTDLALLKVDAEKELSFVKFGDATALRVGDWVLAIGNPFGLGGTVTVGVVSAQNRKGIGSSLYDRFIQTDAAINRGNSGGPLFNLDGDVVGINTAIVSPSGVSAGVAFAIPSDVAETVITQLREFGETRRGWLGVQIQIVTDEIAESLELKSAVGALVARVIKDSPAAKAGVKVTDVIIRFDGTDVKEMQQLPPLVAETAIGKTVDVVVIRDGKEETIQVSLGRLEANDPSSPISKKNTSGPKSVLNLKLTNLSTSVREQYSIDESIQSGVVVVAVEADSPAAESGVQPGSVIQEVSREKVNSVDQFVKQIEGLKSGGKMLALLLIASPTGDLRFVPLSIGK